MGASSVTIGAVYNRLTIVRNLGLSIVDKHGSRRTIVECICSCGNSVSVLYHSLQGKGVQSCGCLLHETSVNNGRMRKRHGEIRTPTWWSWMCMRRRVKGQDVTYKNVILTMDPRWDKYEDFLADMGYRPVGKTLDKDIIKYGNTHYCKEYCMWANPKEQANNRRNNVRPIASTNEQNGSKE